MRLLLALLLTVLPALGLAQSSAVSQADLPQIDTSAAAVSPAQWWIARAAMQETGQPATAMPLWSTPDGRILAIVAMNTGNGAPALPQSPQIGSAVDWRLVDVTSFVTGGLAFKLADSNATAYAKFGRGIVLAPLLQTPGCAQASPLQNIEACAFQTRANAGNAIVGSRWNNADVDLDVSYGLSWLHAGDAAPGPHQPWDLFVGGGDESIPTLLLPGYTLANVQAATFNTQGRWRLDETQSLDLSAALGRIQYDLPGMPLQPALNQAALSLGLHRGDFSGLIVGRMLGPTDPLTGGARWSSIDLGISWRAPWRGVFSVGAQNVWSSGYLPILNEPATREVDPSQARVPYVQYHQDL